MSKVSQANGLPHLGPHSDTAEATDRSLESPQSHFLWDRTSVLYHGVRKGRLALCQEDRMMAEEGVSLPGKGGSSPELGPWPAASRQAQGHGLRPQSGSPEVRDAAGGGPGGDSAAQGSCRRCAPATCPQGQRAMSSDVGRQG